MRIDGCIVDSGTYEELNNRNEAFVEMLRKACEKNKDEKVDEKSITDDNGTDENGIHKTKTDSHV